MTDTPLSYIESDFTSADETLREYRRRAQRPGRRHRVRRVYRRLLVA